eukprot:TRINITY_DN2526_c0_g3_i1.p1 TRINITY_DN2526_c0_g3~~TRINITY_DN2526_c0_g3_i1.p1  ORF type:complete len:814 (+),score=179.65 TRINITY_DN2526_c0_g3_i1:90-2531(+)
MKYIVASILLFALISICTADINLVFGGSFSRVGANINKGLAIFNLNESAWENLNVPPPFGNTITAFTPNTGGTAWVAITDNNGNSNVYYYDGTVYHLLGYTFQGTVNHLFFASPSSLYATGDFSYYYTPNTEDDFGIFLRDFALFEGNPVSPIRANRWRPAPGQNLNPNNGVPGTALKGFPFGNNLYLILTDDGTLYWNRNPTAGPDDNNRWTDSFTDAGTNLVSANVLDILSFQGTFYLWGFFGLTGDTNSHGILSTTTGTTFNIVYSNATVVGLGFKKGGVAINPTIYFIDTQPHFLFGDNRYQIASLAAGQLQARPVQVGRGTFDRAADLLWFSQYDNSLYAYFSNNGNPATYYTPASGSTVDDLPEYGLATYIAANGFVRFNLGNPAEDWQPALGGGVEGSVVEPATSGVYTYLRGDITHTFQETAFGLAGWDQDEASWVPLGNPLLDVPNNVRFPNADRTIIAVVYNEDDGSVVFGGTFATINNVTFNSIGVRDGDGNFSPLADGVSLSTSDRRWEYNPGTVHAITPLDDEGNWAIGGNFDYSGSTPIRNVGLWDGSAWSPMGSGVDDVVWAIETYNDDIIVGGNFLTAGNVHAPYVARYNTEDEVWEAMSVGTNDAVYTIFNDGGTLYIGGSFTAASGRRAWGVAVWDDDDNVWEPLDCDICNSDCRNLDDLELFCPRPGSVVYEIRSVPGEGLYFRIDGNLAKWNGNQFERITNPVSVQTSTTNPQKLISANDLDSEHGSSVTVAGISGAPFFDDNLKIGSVDNDGYVNYHEFGGISDTINSVSGSSLLKPVLVILIACFMAVLLF